MCALQDEVHERDRNADFMLIILRDLLAIRPNLRLVTELRGPRFAYVKDHHRLDLMGVYLIIGGDWPANVSHSSELRGAA